ncbi:MAG: T9SS type A sorting domain-containing protein [Flavobacterium sp.]|nr:T9SS type A sorting domain-containing protein [Flavobacterium sp.]
MKKISYLVLLFIIPFIANAQCNQSGFGFGNNNSTPMYNIQGTVEVVLNTNNSVTLNTGSNFSTASGPDVKVFLVDRGTLTNAQLKNTAMFNARPKIEMGMLPNNGSSPVTGSRTFTKAIPSGMNISNFNTIYFYCQQFNAFWDFGSYTAFSPNNCAVLSSNEFTSIDFSVYPNPVKDQFNISLENSTKLKAVNIYNNLGQIVYTEWNDLDQNVNIASLSKGIYHLEVTDFEGNRSVKNIIKE